MTVHSCVVDDGQNKKVQLLDENGSVVTFLGHFRFVIC